MNTACIELCGIVSPANYRVFAVHKGVSMGLILPRLLSTTSERSWLRMYLLRLPETPPAVSDRISAPPKSIRTPPYSSRNVLWYASGLLGPVKCCNTLITDETGDDNTNEIGNVSQDMIPCSVAPSTTNEVCSGWKMSAERLFVRALRVTSDFYDTMRKKWQSAEDTIEQLKMTLQRRNNQVKELGGVIHELHMTTSEHQRRIELQRNQLEEQEGILLEMYIALQMRDNGPHSLKAQQLGLRLKHTSREYWLLRKHRGNLAKVTKPVIQSMIRLSCAAGLISSSIGACAQNCSSQDHDCTNEFYKALQVTVSERPEALTQFLRILQDNSDSPPCQQLCHKIWKEVTPE